MEVTYRTSDDRITVKVEGEDQKSIVEQLSLFCEVFEAETCGKCNGTDTRFRVRKVQDGKKTHSYYERVCAKCGAKLHYGQHSEGGTLFPKRYDSEANKVIGVRGWVKFNPETKQEE